MTSFVSVLLYVILPLVATAYLYVKKKFSYFRERGIPYVEPKFLLGNLQGIGSTRHMYDIFRTHYDACKGKDVVAGLYNLTQATFFVTDLELVKLITIKDFNNFVNRGAFVNEENEPLSGHLFAIEDDRWRFLRNKLSPGFTSGKIKGMYSAISDKGRHFVEAVEKASRGGKSIEVKDFANRFTVDIISSVAFGMEANTLNFEHPELIKIFSEVFGNDGPSTLYFFFLIAFPNLSKFLRLRQFSKSLSDFFMNIVGGNIKYREESNDQRNDFLNMLIQLKNKGSIDGELSSETRKLTLNEVMAQAFLFFFAGSDTSSTTISFALVELAQNPEMQEKLRAEINAKTKADNGDITYDNLHEMTYLNQVVSETLRKYTPGFGLFRKAANDYRIPDTKHVIPKDASIFIPTIGFHFDERYWKDPEAFDPDRFTQEEIAKRPANCYFPFGIGNRNCIGNRFGLINVKYGVAIMVQNFKLAKDPRMRYPIKMNPRNPNLEPDTGFWMRMEKI